jgi:hypothetical protein
MAKEWNFAYLSPIFRASMLSGLARQAATQSLEMLRVYCRDAELFAGNAAAGLL